MLNDQARIYGFHEALVNAEAPLNSFEKRKIFLKVVCP